MPDTAGPVLGFDTSAAHCAAAVVSGDRVLAMRFEPMAKGQAERLIGERARRRGASPKLR